MPKVSKINFVRVTLSLPKKTVALLREKVPKNKRSEFIAELLDENLEEEEQTVDEFMDDLDELIDSIDIPPGKSSLEILREIRYGNEK